MAIKLFVAGFSYTMTDSELSDLFAEYGNVTSAQVITDRDTRKSKGFGFVEFESDADGQAAMAALNGKDMDGRALTVNVARPREDRPARPSYQDNRNTMGNNFRRSRR